MVERSAAVTRYLGKAQAKNTADAYASDWREFEAWCKSNSATPLPADDETVAAYIASMADSDGAKRNTITRRVAAINSYHEQAGHVRPGASALVRGVLAGIRREKADEELDQAAPLTIELLARCIDALAGTEMKRARDAALLTLGFAGALRRSELVAVRVRDVVLTPAGGELTIPHSKTDQEGTGARVALARCADLRVDPNVAIQRWLELSGVRAGPLLRGVKKNQTVSLNALHPETVNELIRQAVARTGMSEADVAEFSGHSLRSGFVTSARAAGVPDHVIMRTTRHKDQRMLQTYTRTPEFFETAATWASW